MLTKADEYPVHQTPEPVAYSGTDPNFYDRYFFNGYAADGDGFLAVALGVYPHLNVMDAAFVVSRTGVQHNLRASRELGMERMDTAVGPIRIDVVEPLRSLRVRVDDPKRGIRADLVFRSRAPALEEPRFTYRAGPRTVMDYTRMTQNGTWEGWFAIGDERVEVEPWRWFGTRDRSWGIRPVGGQDPRPVVPPQPPQFYWLWSPLNFEDCITLFHVNADAGGTPWNTHALLCPLGEEAAPRAMRGGRAEIDFRSGTRHARRATLHFEDLDGGETTIELEPRYHFYMSGAGYLHPEWGHGMYRGELDVDYDRYVLDAVPENEQLYLHVQAFVRARMRGALGDRDGCGVLEQLIVGPHAPSGFTDILDPAP